MKTKIILAIMALSISIFGLMSCTEQASNTMPSDNSSEFSSSNVSKLSILNTEVSYQLNQTWHNFFSLKDQFIGLCDYQSFSNMYKSNIFVASDMNSIPTEFNDWIVENYTMIQSISLQDYYNNANISDLVKNYIRQIADIIANVNDIAEMDSKITEIKKAINSDFGLLSSKKSILLNACELSLANAVYWNNLIDEDKDVWFVQTGCKPDYEGELPIFTKPTMQMFLGSLFWFGNGNIKFMPDGFISLKGVVVLPGSWLEVLIKMGLVKLEPDIAEVWLGEVDLGNWGK